MCEARASRENGSFVLQEGGVPSSMQPHMDFFEEAFLAPLEQASAESVLRASRERQASSMEW